MTKIIYIDLDENERIVKDKPRAKIETDLSIDSVINGLNKQGILEKNTHNVKGQTYIVNDDTVVVFINPYEYIIPYEVNV